MGFFPRSHLAAKRTWSFPSPPAQVKSSSVIQHFAEYPERPFTQVVSCQAKALAMLHSSSGRVHFPVNTGRADRRTIQRGRLQVSAAIKKGKEKNVVCTKTIVAKQETVDAVERMCKDIMDFSHGKQKVKSSGIMEFGVSRDQYEPNVFYTWERYDSNGALGRHNTCPEFQAFMENIQTHLEGPIGIALYEWKDGQIGAASIQGGPKGEGGLDDATGAGGTGASRMTQTSATVDLGHTKREDDGLWGMGFKFPWQKKDAKK